MTDQLEPDVTCIFYIYQPKKAIIHLEKTFTYVLLKLEEP